MINTSYANYTNAYKEVLIVINNLTKEDYDKIPKEYIKFFKEKCNNQHEFKYDTSKPFSEQMLLDDTKIILFWLFAKYGATEIQKEKIENYKTNYRIKLEQQNREKYNPDNIFKNKKEEIVKETKEVSIENHIEPTEMIKYKESIFKKLISKIKKIIHK